MKTKSKVKLVTKSELLGKREIKVLKRKIKKAFADLHKHGKVLEKIIEHYYDQLNDCSDKLAKVRSGPERNVLDKNIDAYEVAVDELQYFLSDHDAHSI